MQVGTNLPWTRVGVFLILLYAAWYFYLALGISLPLAINGLLDDSFYYLQVARNVAAGAGSSFDGIELTNGYHPLWMWLLVPVHWVAAARPETCLRIGLVISSVLGVGVLLWIRHVLNRQATAWAAAIGLLLFAWPRILGQTVNMLESGLLLFTYMTIVALLVSNRATAAGRGVAFGILLGLAALARLDTVFLWIAVGILGVARGLQGRALIHAPEIPIERDRGRLARIVENVAPLALGLVIVAPYLYWNHSRFGHWTPVSGYVKTSFPHPEFQARTFLDFKEFTLLALVGVGFLLASLRPRSSRIVQALGIFGLASALHMAYTVLFMRWGVDRWHFAITIPAGVLGLPLLLDRALGVFAPGRGRALRVALVAGGVVLAIAAQGYSLRARAGRHLDGSRAVALWARDHLPEDSVYAMTDAGVFAYFSGRTTVNLDGLINNYRYQDYLRAGRLVEYFEEKSIDYVYEQASYGRADYLDGTYTTRPFRIWYRHGNRLAGEITLYREDEVKRVNVVSRLAAMQEPQRNALILYRYRKPAGAPPAATAPSP